MIDPKLTGAEVERLDLATRRIREALEAIRDLDLNEAERGLLGATQAIVRHKHGIKVAR